MTADTRPKDTIRDAFEAMIALLQMLINRKFSGLYTPAVRLGVEAAEEVELTHWHPQKAFLALRDLIQRAAEEHNRRAAVGGDWTAGGRVEGAFLAGQALAGRILGLR